MKTPRRFASAALKILPRFIFIPVFTLKTWRKSWGKNEIFNLIFCRAFQASSEKGKKMENLATVMTLYSRRTFSKESFQWTKCVVKYLHDSYSSLTLPMVSFLVEVITKLSLHCSSITVNISVDLSLFLSSLD